MFEGDPGLRIGTSSWSEKDWVGVFYPPGTPSARFIEHYATVFDTVEVDATFYRMPSETMVDAWVRRTPPHFRFAAKVPRSITHEKVLVDAVGEMTLFVETMARLGERLGPLLLQFPYFNREAFPSPEPFFERLDRFLGEIPTSARTVVELRNPRWVGKEAQEVCARHRVALAWVEQSWMLHAKEWPRRTGGPSADFAYIRFLGDHKAIEAITDRWDRAVIDRSDVIERWVPVLRELRARRVDVFGFFNNHFAGHAPASIELFREIWRRSGESEPRGAPPAQPSPSSDAQDPTR